MLGIGRARRWCDSWWARLPEPRDLSAAFQAMYAWFAVLGALILIWPPRSLVGALDSRVALSVLCLFMLVGAAVGSRAAYREDWRVERLALFILAVPTGMYGLITLTLHTLLPGSRLFVLLYVGLGGMLLFVRWLLIRWYSYRPGSRCELLDDDDRGPA